MKVIEARNILSQYSGNDLWREARKLCEEEIEKRINLRSHGKPLSRGVIESVVGEIRPWMERVCSDLSWDNNESPKLIIEQGIADTWVEYGMIDPRVDDYRKRVRLGMLRGTPYPLAATMTSQDLDAITSMMLARLRNSFRALGENGEEYRANTPLREPEEREGVDKFMAVQDLQRIGEYANEGIDLLKNRGYIEQQGDGIRLTAEWTQIYSISLQIRMRKPGVSLLDVKDEALMEAILYKGPATTEEIVYMSNTINALVKANAFRVI